MVFIVRLIKASVLKKKHERYIELKKDTLKEQQKKLGIFYKFQFWWQRTCPLLCGGKRQPNEPFSRFEKFQISIKTSGTYENYIGKSILGFLSGVLLTFILFMFFVFQLKFSLAVATYMTSIIGLILTLGLAFSSRVRCIVLMMLPQFFSKRGRQAIVAYAYILALTGPAKNTLYNMRVLSETMACNQEKLKAAIKNIVDMIKEPFRALRETMKKIAVKVKIIVGRVKAMILAIKKTIQSLIGVIKNAYEWLNSVVGMCSKKVGTPFERCTKSFEAAIVDCKDKLGPLFQWMCSTAYVASHLCYAVKPFDFVCDLIDFVSDDIVETVKEKMREFSYKVRHIFYVSIQFSHAFGFSTEQSKSIKDVSSGIMEEVKHKTAKLSFFFDWMSLMLSFFFLFMVCRVLNYKRKFMNNDAYDNHFITENIIKLDINRTKQGLETILPLNIYEKRKFVEMSSMRLVKSERAVIAKSAVFLALYTIKLIIHILLDYSLWWILNIIRVHGQYETHVDAPGSINVEVDGKGMLSELYASVFNAFHPTADKVDTDVSPCLPEPLPPNVARYKEIGILVVIAWILSFAEPYGLRLRFAVMSYYYPDRAKVRAVWLYNNIIRSRGSFLKFARRQLRRKFAKGEEGIEEVSIMDRLRAKFPLFRRIFKGKQLTACLLCGTLGSKNSPLVKCPRPDCVGIFCVNCYANLQSLCTICRLPIEYGDLSDISEEKDSSEDLNKPTLGKNLEGTSDTSEELNLTEALASEENDSELSYGYQYRERDISERIEVPLRHTDVEAQKPKDRVSIFDYGDEAPAPNQNLDMTLAERKKSGLWGLIPDEEHDFSSWPERKQSHKPSINEKLLRKRTLNADETALLLHEIELSGEDTDNQSAISTRNYQSNQRRRNYKCEKLGLDAIKNRRSDFSAVKCKETGTHLMKYTNLLTADSHSKKNYTMTVSPSEEDLSGSGEGEELDGEMKEEVVNKSNESMEDDSEEEEIEEFEDEEDGYEPEEEDESLEEPEHNASAPLLKKVRLSKGEASIKKVAMEDQKDDKNNKVWLTDEEKRKTLLKSKPKSILKKSHKFTEMRKNISENEEDVYSEFKSHEKSITEKNSSLINKRFPKERLMELPHKRDSSSHLSMPRYPNSAKKPRLSSEEQPLKSTLNNTLSSQSQYQCTLFPELAGIQKSSNSQLHNAPLAHSPLCSTRQEGHIMQSNQDTLNSNVLLKSFETMRYNIRSAESPRTTNDYFISNTDKEVSRKIFNSKENKKCILKEDKSTNVYSEEPMVHFIQSPRFKSNKRAQQLNRRNLSFDGGKAEKIKMVKSWIASGTYFQSIDNTSRQTLMSSHGHQQIQSGFKHLFELFNISRFWKNWNPTNEKKCDHIELIQRQKQMNTLKQLSNSREKYENKLRKSGKKNIYFWNNFKFWRKKDDSSYSSMCESSFSDGY